MSNNRSLLVGALVAVAVLVVGPAPGFGADADLPYDVQTVESPRPQAGGLWGERMVPVADIDGDGAKDVFVTALKETVGSVANAGRVYLLSGRTGSVIYAIDPPEPQTSLHPFSGFGWSLSPLGDVDGDGKEDLAAGTVTQSVHTGSGPPCGAAEPNGCNEQQGRAWIFSGATGRLLHTLDNPNPQGNNDNPAHFGWVGTAGDVTGDGRSEVLVGASKNDVPTACGDLDPRPNDCRVDQGQAFIFNGATGALVRTLDMPSEDLYPAGESCFINCGEFGMIVQTPGDTDGDGVNDHLIDAWFYSAYSGSGAPCGDPEPNGCNEQQGRMYVFSGQTGKLLLKIDNPQPQAGARFGLQLVEPLAPGDVDGDGTADIYGNGFAQNGPAGAAQGRAWVFNGRTGALLYTLDDPRPENGGQFGYSLSRTNHNKDGVPDLYVGSSPHHVPNTLQTGSTHVFDGRDGSLLRSFLIPESDKQPGVGPNRGPNFGRAVVAPGDVNGDDEPDYLASGPRVDVAGRQDQGRVYRFLSKRQPAGYWLGASDGGIFAFGPSAEFSGSTGDIRLNSPVVGMAPDPDGKGYWLVAADGGVFAFDAPFYGSTGNLRLNSPVVGIAAVPGGGGYYLVAADGGVFAFGATARFAGSTGAIKLNKPIVGMAADRDEQGYWLFASDGGVFSFDAAFAGSAGSLRLNQPIVGGAADLDGTGYWLAASDGGIFAFDAGFHGSTGAIKLNQPIVGMAADPDRDGYWLVAADGGIFAFDAAFHGSTGAIKLNQPIVGMGPA